MKERGAWPHFLVVDVAVQGLRQSEDELRHAAKSPPKGLQNSLICRYAKVRLGPGFAVHFRTMLPLRCTLCAESRGSRPAVLASVGPGTASRSTMLSHSASTNSFCSSTDSWRTWSNKD